MMVTSPVVTLILAKKLTSVLSSSLAIANRDGSSSVEILYVKSLTVAVPAPSLITILLSVMKAVGITVIVTVAVSLSVPSDIV